MWEIRAWGDREDLEILNLFLSAKPICCTNLICISSPLFSRNSYCFLSVWYILNLSQSKGVLLGLSKPKINKIGKMSFLCQRFLTGISRSTWRSPKLYYSIILVLNKALNLFSNPFCGQLTWWELLILTLPKPYIDYVVTTESFF